MEVLVRKLVWRKPVVIERMPLLARLHRAAYAEAPRTRDKIFRYPLFRLFPALYRLGLGGRGALSLRPGGKRLPFDARNLQFAALYMPQHEAGYEPETTALLGALVGPASVFYDVGSNWGYYALVLAAQGAGKVHAFEPLPASFRDLEGLTRAAGLESRVSCHNLALSDRSGKGRIAIPDGLHSGTATIGAEGTEAALARIDELDHEPPDVLKVDAEGHEARVLEGGRKTLERRRPYVVFESVLSREGPQALLAPFALLEGLGYRFFRTAWLGRDPLHLAEEIRLTEGAEIELALVPFEPQQRFLFRDHVNVLAVHGGRMAELRATFAPVRL